MEKALPHNVALVVYHAMTMNHLRQDRKESAFESLLRGLSSKRRLFEASVEWEPTENAARSVEVVLSEWRSGGAVREFIGWSDKSADGRYIVCP